MNPGDGYIAYIVNPCSGASSSKLIGHRFRGYLMSRGFEVRMHHTQSLDHAYRLAKGAAADSNCVMIVGVGGDGTIREVVSGLAGCGKPLLIIPHGTENLLASELGFDEKVQTLIDTFEHGCIKPLDLGKVNGRYFSSIVGFGFDGRVVERVSQRRSGNIDYFDYIDPLWRTFWDYRYEHMKVQADGCDVFDGRGLVFVGNISRYAVGLEILRHADYSDGLLDLCIYKCSSKVHLVKHSLMTLLKHHAHRHDVIYRQVKNVHISSDGEDIKTEIDGDPGPALPVSIEVVPGAIKVMVPKNAKPAGIRTRIIRSLG